jgi:putative ATP-dependent endonuclease of the OLD family
MSKLHTLKISNFRCIENFEHNFGFVDLVCFIGRGDSGKTTLLDAISYALSPRWNLAISDTDFFELDIDREIVIEATVYDLPSQLLREGTFGLHQRFINSGSGELQDEAEANAVPALTIQLKVNRELEPRWFVVNERQDPKEIRSKDRSVLNVFMVSDYVDRHFSWTRGGPLYSLLRQEDDADTKNNAIIEIMRGAKKQIDDHAFENLDAVVKKVKAGAAILGVDIADVTTTIDLRDISIKDGKVTLHDERIPFRLKGKGSRRLISIAIQRELAKAGGIMLVDELEQGLEPDRSQHLVSTLRKDVAGQVFVTTHSSSVLIETDAKGLFLVRRGQNNLTTFSSDLQGCLRRNPDAFFASKVAICEGATEVGFCHALDEFRIEVGKLSASLKGVCFADGSGSTQYEYAKGFRECGYDVCYVTDSDIRAKTTIEEKQELNNLGVVVVECEAENAIEQQVFKDLPWDGVIELVAYAEENRTPESIEDSMKTAYQEVGLLPANWRQMETPEIRSALGRASKKAEWFKRFDHGEFLGKTCCKYLERMDGTHLATQINTVSTWIDNA